ncbi:MAG: alpha/beta fold hydrolase [Anaerolineales bacterium]|nr:alpha/beta fold hydrolase [Anaerolineales bacterium]
MPLRENIYYHYFEGGNRAKPPVILIHGAAGTHLHWPAEVRRLSGNPVYALDLPGHGKSESRSYQAIAEYQNALLSWLAALGIYQAILIGHSMGGAIALSMALDHPERVLGLGLIGTGARLRVNEQILENAASAATVPAALEAIVTLAFGEQADPRLVELAAMRMAGTRHSVLHGDLLACTSFDRLAELGQIRVPTQVIVGQKDQLTPVRYSQHLADQIPNASLQIIPGAGHMVMLEQPQQVAEILQAFITKIPFHPGQQQ